MIEYFNQFKIAYGNLVKEWDRVEEIYELNDFEAIKKYPFLLSFEELNIYEWFDEALEHLAQYEEIREKDYYGLELFKKDGEGNIVEELTQFKIAYQELLKEWQQSESKYNLKCLLTVDSYPFPIRFDKLEIGINKWVDEMIKEVLEINMSRNDTQDTDVNSYDNKGQPMKILMEKDG